MLAIATWKIPLLILMTLASMGVQGILTYVAFRRNAKLAAVGFIVAFLCLVGMGALASGEQTSARQWTAQSVNTVGQLGFMVGSILLFQKIAKLKTTNRLISNFSDRADNLRKDGGFSLTGEN
jgi:hypothetical protein